MKKSFKVAIQVLKRLVASFFNYLSTVMEITILCLNKIQTQAEAEVVPSSSLVKVEVEVGVEVGVEVDFEGRANFEG